MKRPLLCLLLPALAGLPLCASQTPDEPAPSEPVVEQQAEPVVTYPLPSNWELGTKYRIELTKTLRHQANERVMRNTKWVTPVDVEVFKQDEQGYSLRWTFGEAKSLVSEGSQAGMAEMLAHSIHVLDGFSYELRTRPDGTIADFVNERIVLKDAAEALVKYDRKVNGLKHTPQIKRGLKIMAKQVLGPQALYKTLLDDPSMFYAPAGASFELGVAREYRGEAPSIYPGAGFPTDASYLLEEYDEEQGIARLHWRQETDPEITRRMILAQYRELGGMFGEPIDENKVPGYSQANDARYVWDLATGVPQRVEHALAVSQGPTLRVETQTFVVSWPSEEEAEEPEGEAKPTAESAKEE